MTVWVLMWGDGDGDSADVFSSEEGATTELERRRAREDERAKTEGHYYTRGGGYVYETEVRSDAA